ncbi:nucleolin-like [Gossypium australe]|uniref:Nucleolin-like n=1 Tax=Gossypium australe TaxID=47621 RepID=A0A5B6W7E5_9ROSI|nr:nucleolin-like [Gossypium australe]
MEDDLAKLSLTDDEEEAFIEDAAVVERFYQCCLVGRCLTDSVFPFPSLRNTMADIWHPLGGIYITDVGDKKYLFQFFHEVDVQRVLAGTPWFFNNHLLILQRIPDGLNPSNMPLNFADFWIQIHDLPAGLMTESMAKQLGDFYGKFKEYDSTAQMVGFKNYMRIRQNMTISRWLRDADGSQIAGGNWKSSNFGNSLNSEKDMAKKMKMELVRMRCGFENGIDIGAFGTKGGLSLGWKGKPLVTLKSFSSFHIDVEIQEEDYGAKWRLTGFYGNPDERLRTTSWNLLR